eukprot:910540-Pyramimonas_sp.AAC.1
MGFLPPVVADSAPKGKHFGAVLADVDATKPYRAGDIVQATFQSVRGPTNRSAGGNCADQSRTRGFGIVGYGIVGFGIVGFGIVGFRIVGFGNVECGIVGLGLGS